MKRLIIPFACILCLCALLLRSPAHAQPAQVLEAGSEPAQQSMALTVGDILEILPLHTVKDAKYAWILTQDRSFIEAQRTSVYRTRLTLPGNYTLFAEISGADTSSTIRRTFQLTVTGKETMPDGVNPIPASGGSGETLVTSDPKAGPEARIIIPQGEETLTLIPLDADRKPLALDLDTQTDSNGDGTVNNDVDDANTYFQTNATPLTLWFASPLSSFTMAVTAVGTDGNAVVQTFSVFSYNAAKSAGVMISPANIVIDQKSDSVFEFSVDFKDAVPGSTPLLYHWKFGDGEESLVAKPVHTYHGSGTYTVQLSIQNLLSGKEVAHYETQIQVTVAAGNGGDSSAPSSSPAVTPVGTGSEGGIGIWTILLLALVLIISIGAGIGIMFLLSRLLKKRKPLHETIAEMEASMTKGDQVPPPAAPLIIESKKTETAAPAAVKKETTTPLPAVDVNAAPSWLKKGLNENSGTMPPAASPAPLPPSMPAAKAPAPLSPPPPPMPVAPRLPTPPTPSLPPTPPTPSAAVPPAPVQPAAMPSWLQTGNAAAAKAPTPAPSPVVPPSAAPAPKPEVPKVTAPAAVPPPPARKPIVTPPAPAIPPAPAVIAPSTAVKPAPVVPAPTPASTTITPPAALKPAPIVPPAAKTESSAATLPQSPAPAAAAPVKADAAIPPTPKPAAPAPTPVTVPPKAPATAVVPPPAAEKKESLPAPAKPIAPAPAPTPVVTPPKAPAAPAVPAAPKSLPPIPDKELPPAKVPAASQVQTPMPTTALETKKQATSNEPTSNVIPDPTIAVIRAESIEDQNKKNGQGKNQAA